MKKNQERTIIDKDLAESLLRKYSSPLFVYSSEIIQEKAKNLKEAAKGYHISYAMKANSNKHILKILQEN